MNAPYVVLLVDSSQTDRSTYQDWLNQDSQSVFTFLEANCGDIALDVCQQLMPDVIILSDRLSDRDGVDLLRQLKQQLSQRQVPVIILSEQEDVAAAVQAMKHGAQDYLIKSKLTCAILCHTVKEAISGQTANTACIEAARKQAEFLLKQSEATNRAIVQAIPDLLIRMTREGDCLDIIRGETIKGAYPKYAVQDTPTFAALFPDLSQEKLHYIQKALETEELQVYEQEIQIAGSTQFEEVRITPNGPNEVLIIVRDITQQHAMMRELKQIEAALKQSEATNRAIFAVIPDVLVRMSRDGRCLDFVTSSNSEGFYPQGAAPGQSITKYLPPSLAAQRLHYVHLALESGELQIYEQEIQVADSQRAEEVRIVPSGADEVLVIVRDISERKQAEAALRQSESTNRALIAAIPDLLIRVKPDGTYLEIAGRDRLQVQNNAIFSIGSNVYDSLPPDQAQLRMDHIQKALETNTIQVYEQQFGKDEQIQYEEVRIVVSRDNELLIIVRDITDRKQAEQALRQLNQELEQRVAQRTAALQASETVLQAVFNQIAVGMNITNPDGHYLKVNQAHCDIIGYTPEELLQIGFNQITHPEDREKGWGERQRLLSGEIDSFSLEKRYIRKDGGLVWVNITVSAVRKDSGEVDYTICVVKDISQRKQVEAQLRYSEARYRAIVEDQTELIARFALDTTLLFVNEAYCRYFGVEREAIVGTSYAPKVHEADQESVGQLIQSMSIDNPTVTIENRLIVNGEIRWTQWINRMLLDEQGNFIEYQAVGRDITARKQAEMRLQQQLEREVLITTITQRIRESLDLSTILNITVSEIQQLLQADRVLVYRLLPDGSGRTIAESRDFIWQPMLNLGFSSEAFPPEGYRRYVQGHIHVLPDRSQEQVLPCMVQFMQTFDIQAKLVAPIIHQDTLWGLLIVHQCAAPRQWQSWEVHLLQQLANQLAIATKQSELYQQLQTELGEREKTQQLLQKANRHLRVSNQELARATRHKDEFLANMSHELRTPLNAILGMSEALLEEICGSLTEHQKKAVTTISKSGNHLLELINDILDLAKIEAGKLELRFTTVAIAPLCHNSLTFIKPMADKKGIQLQSQISAHIGSVQADDRRLQQVLINLLSNAVKFTPAGGSVTLEAYVEEAPQKYGDTERGLSAFTPLSRSPGKNKLPPSLYLSVTDTGIGIAQADLDQIFQPFRQIDSSLSRQYTGTGLGLALVRHIVDMHQGIITVESKIGEGSRFTVRLPQYGIDQIYSEPASSLNS